MMAKYGLALEEDDPKMVKNRARKCLSAKQNKTPGKVLKQTHQMLVEFSATLYETHQT